MKAFVFTAISTVRHTQTCQARIGAHAEVEPGREPIASPGEEPRRWLHARKMRAFMGSRADLA